MIAFLLALAVILTIATWFLIGEYIANRRFERDAAARIRRIRRELDGLPPVDDGWRG